MSREIIHAIILIFAIALTFIIPATTLSQYDLQIAAFLFVVLFISKRLTILQRGSRLMESVIFTLVILLIINTTGGAASPFFFLVYFLLFSLSLLLEPVISIITTLTLIIFFLFSLPPNQDFKQLLPILSLAFITPFAMLLGQEYIEVQKSKLKTQKLKEDTFLFLSLMIKNHLKSIKGEVENFLGDHQLHQIKKHTTEMERLIEKFEKS